MTSPVATVPDASDVTVTVRTSLQHTCPYVDEVDRGHVTITWRVDGETFELHALAGYLQGFKDARLSHEEITERIRFDLTCATELIELVSVETVWETAGMEVRCSTSLTPAPLT